MTRSFARPARLVVLAAIIAVAACTTQNESPKVPLAGSPRTDSASAVEAAHALIGPAARAALDSGNTLFRKKSYEAALAQYRHASMLAPQHSAPLFGIYMVARATNNPVMADSALAGIRLRSGTMSPAPHVTSDTALQRLHASLKKRPADG